MTHHSRLFKIVIDVPDGDLDAELAFWQAASGQPLTQNSRFPEYYGSALHGQEFALLVQRLDAPGVVAVDIPAAEATAQPPRQGCRWAHRPPPDGA